jgi:hypothetical protein
MRAATQTVNKRQNGFRFRFEDNLDDQLPVRIPNRTGEAGLVHIQPNLFGVMHEDHNLNREGAAFHSAFLMAGGANFSRMQTSWRNSLSWVRLGL